MIKSEKVNNLLKIDKLCSWTYPLFILLNNNFIMYNFDYDYDYHFYLDNPFDLAIRNYYKSPSFDNFKEICNHVKPEMLRGAVNPDNYGKGTMLHCDIIDLAMVYRGYKPMALIYPKSQIPEFFDQLGLKMIYFTKVYLDPDIIEHKYVVWKDDDKDNAAKEFVDYIKNYVFDRSTSHLNNEIVGNYLGYPKKDIDYMNNRNRIFKYY